MHLQYLFYTSRHLTNNSNPQPYQGDKSKLLVSTEGQKTEELERHYENEVLVRKENLKPRMSQLEEDFKKQRQEQDRFYHNSNVPSVPPVSSLG